MSSNIQIPKVKYNYAAPWPWHAWTGIAFWVGYTGIIGFAINGVLGLVLWIAVAGAVTLFFEWFTAVTDDKLQEIQTAALQNPEGLVIRVRGKTQNWRDGGYNSRTGLFFLYQLSQYVIISFLLLQYFILVQSPSSEGFVFLADLVLRPENDILGIIHREESFVKMLSNHGRLDALPLPALVIQVLTFPLFYYFLRLMVGSYLLDSEYLVYLQELKPKFNLMRELKVYSLFGSFAILMGFNGVYSIFFWTYTRLDINRPIEIILEEFCYGYFRSMCFFALAICILVGMCSSIALKITCFTKKVGPFSPGNGSGQS